MTVSPAKLFVAYRTNAIQHSYSVNLQEGVDIQNITALRADANALSDAVQACVTPHVIQYAWGLRTLSGGSLWVESFPSSKPGTNTAPLNATAFNSNTVRVEGKAAGITVGGDAGRTSFEIFVSDSVLMVPGDQYLDSGTIPSWSGLKALIDASTRYFCDLFGQKADVANLMPVQYNAHAQRKHGN